MKITNQDTNSPTISIEIPKGHEPQYTRVGDYIKLTFEPKAEPKLPMSWEELGIIKGVYVTTTGYLVGDIQSEIGSQHKNTWPTREEAEASIALAQLLQLRNAWGGFHNNNRHEMDKSWATQLYCSTHYSLVLCFPTIELRDRFQTQFADLIKTASPLL